MELDDLNRIVMMSSGFDSARLSLDAMPLTCAQVAWHPWYVVLRAETVYQCKDGKSMSNVPEVRSESEKQHPTWSLSVPIRSLLMCVPRACNNPYEHITKLAVYLAEQTLPAYCRTGCLSTPEIIFAEKLDTLHGRVGRLRLKNRYIRAVSMLLPFRLSGVPCHSAACASLQLAGQLGNSSFFDDAIVVIDVGSGRISEFLQHGQLDENARLRLIAVEPNPDIIMKVHESHPRLAILQAAVGRTGKSGYATLNLAHADYCNSLKPFSSAARSAHAEASQLIRECLTPDESKVVKVRVVSLADILQLLPSFQEVALLKVDAQGSDLDVITSARSELHRIRRLQIEVFDYLPGDTRLPYKGQASKLEIIKVLSARGFVLDACHETQWQYHEEDCLFVRADILAQQSLPRAEESIHGDFDWNRARLPSSRFFMNNLPNERSHRTF